MQDKKYICLKNISTHNLKNIDVEFPLGCLTTVTGVSGSGKSSLVFDTLYAESYRRYIDSLSSYARQYLKTMVKPDIEDVINLPPAIAVKQNKMHTHNRSTVATLTEIHDLFQVMFVQLSTIYCHKCQEPVEAKNPLEVYQSCLTLENHSMVQIMAPMKKWSNLAEAKLIEQLNAQGYSRVYISGENKKLNEIKLSELHSAYCVIDRIRWNHENKQRFLQSCSQAFQLGRGVLTIKSIQGLHDFANSEECISCGEQYKRPMNQIFSFNHPLGACQDCQGFGKVQEIDWQKVTPDLSASILSRGIAPFNFGKHTIFYKKFTDDAARVGIDIAKPFSDFSPNDWLWFRHGTHKKSYPNFKGMDGYFVWLKKKIYKTHIRIHSAKFHHYTLCPACSGHRFNQKTKQYKVEGKSIDDFFQTSVSELLTWLQNTKVFSNNRSKNLDEVYEEFITRVQSMVKLGLDYLTLNRVSTSLSGGELQRIHLARCLGSVLTDTLYCLDEPTCGLHARDIDKLQEFIKELRDQGNTIVAVEHDQTFIKNSDHCIVVGPGAGHLGGSIVKNAKTEISVNHATTERKLPKNMDFLTLNEASMNNLKKIRAKFAIGQLNVVCGVSGSGKTSLVLHCLYPSMLEYLGKNSENLYQKSCGSVGFSDSKLTADEALIINQKPLSGSSRSNIATYLGIWEHIRKLLAAEVKAKEMNLTPASFSFNLSGGRCESCKGMGSIPEDLSYLGEVQVVCPSCLGERFNQDVLSVRYQGLNVNDILNLTILQAKAQFSEHRKISAILEPVIELGLGYMTLGQKTSSFSGGEAQRLKLLNVLKVANTAKNTLIIIFDEPSKGLSDYDVGLLLVYLRKLTRKGLTLIVVEHHLQFIKSADWLIEIGPEAGERGGEILYQGQPSGLADVTASVTRHYL